MKKLLLVLAVVAMASFLFVGCLGTGIVDDGEDEEDGVITEVTVEIEDAVVIDGKTYVSGGAHDITVSFPAPVVGSVTAVLGNCTGDYRTLLEDLLLYAGASVALFPDADRKVWTGSAKFGYEDGCCASYLLVSSGECEDEICIKLPVIVDSCYPFAEIEITVDHEDCVCGGCEITFESTETDPLCEDPEECCGDLCSGLFSWSIAIYDADPFDVCCDPDICEVSIGGCSGTDCPILCTTECLDPTEDPYWAVITLVDEVLLETTYVAEIILTGGADPGDTCDIIVVEYEFLDDPENCIMVMDTDDYVGICVDGVDDEVCMEEVD